jgi:type II secretory pathway pseudopilin PulG
MAGMRLRSAEMGMSLVELLVASTLFGLLLLLLTPAWGGLLRETRLLETRASLLSETQVARAFLLADAVEAKSVSCQGGHRVVNFSMSKVGGLPRVIEYRFRDGNLYRWDWPPGSEMLVARGLDELDCDPKGPDTSIVLTSGGLDTPYRLHVLVSNAPPRREPPKGDTPPGEGSSEALATPTEVSR